MQNVLRDTQKLSSIDIQISCIKFDTTNLDVYGSHQKAVIDNTEIMGNENNLYFDFGGSVTIARVSKYEVSQVGDEVEFTFMPHKMHFFDKETEQVIGAE